MRTHPSYSLDEAQALLPVVRSTLLQLAFERRKTDSSAEEREGRLQGLLAHLESLGVVVRDLDAGLVDFPTVRDGEPAWLCWRLADPEIGFWHTTREGFASRKPL